MEAAARLAANLRRQRGNLSQKAFARKLGVSRATVTRLEAGSQNATLKTLDQLSKALRCDVADLFRAEPTVVDDC